MMKHHPNYEFIWVFKKPGNVYLPGPAKKVKKVQPLTMKLILKQNTGLLMLDYHFI